MRWSHSLCLGAVKTSLAHFDIMGSFGNLQFIKLKRGFCNDTSVKDALLTHFNFWLCFVILCYLPLNTDLPQNKDHATNNIDSNSNSYILTAIKMVSN